jgi:hypothetical protein
MGNVLPTPQEAEGGRIEFQGERFSEGILLVTAGTIR